MFRKLVLCLVFTLLPSLSFAFAPIVPLEPVTGPPEKTEAVEPVPESIQPTASMMTTFETLAPTAAAMAVTEAPPLVWESTLGTNLNLYDDSFAHIPIGFTFTFYGQPYTDLYVGANGYITFNHGDYNWYP